MTTPHPFTPTSAEMRARARTDLRMGLPVVIEGALVFAIETLQNDRFDALRKMDQPVEIAVTDWRAATLKAHAYDVGTARFGLPADATLDWVHSVADPATDLRHPMKGPFKSLRGGNTDIHRAGIALAKSAQLLPAVIVVAGPHVTLGLTQVGTDIPERATFAEVVHARLPLEASQAGRLHIFRPDDGGTEHYAIEIGSPDRSQPVLSRLHSACFTGDVLGSLKCDCGPQLRAALEAMGQEGNGVLLYLNQEGRGIGLANKMRAYALQNMGFDTVEANHRLGFEDDERDLALGADLLRKLGFTSTRLMTNNPAKVARMNDHGVEVVERVPLKVGETPENAHYLAVKAAKSGHLL
ncbi:GTP cyclohydrolase II [Shimia ponticola]|uniref:GTP cyclohydrolase II n=1 Tax=Shimia ponticola TaxID=2582893 RepID=UPI0011BDF524|nr:GTP cyclohydrolase II [Shimia ponticola]